MSETRLTEEEWETLRLRVEDWLRSTSEFYAGPVGSPTWVAGLVGYLADGPHSVKEILAARLADVEALREKWDGVRDGVLSPGLRMAVGDLDREWFAKTVERKGREAAREDAPRVALSPDVSPERSQG